VVAVGDQSPWVRRRNIELADLMSENWALPASDNPFGSFVVDAFRASGLDVPRATVVTTTLEMRANLLRTGRYLTILPEFWLQFPARHPFIRTLPVALATSGAPIGIATLRGRVASTLIQRFIACARDVAKPLART
jgi:DNA-binding transcriptional LysR family regulator